MSFKFQLLYFSVLKYPYGCHLFAENLFFFYRLKHVYICLLKHFYDGCFIICKILTSVASQFYHLLSLIIHFEIFLVLGVSDFEN